MLGVADSILKLIIHRNKSPERIKLHISPAYFLEGNLDERLGFQAPVLVEVVFVADGKAGIAEQVCLAGAFIQRGGLSAVIAAVIIVEPIVFAQHHVGGQSARGKKAGVLELLHIVFQGERDIQDKALGPDAAGGSPRIPVGRRVIIPASGAVFNAGMNDPTG